MANPTPGPWEFEPRDEINASDVERPWIGRLAENRFAALACGDSADEAWANARLIAAAPALLEACELLIAASADALPEDQFRKAVDAIRAALSLAKGESA